MIPDNNQTIMGYGLLIGPMKSYKTGELVFAEMMPSSPKRVWRELHIRWWFEIIGVAPSGESTHYHMYDGGGMTFRRALSNAMEGVMFAVREIDNEAE